MNAEDLTRDLAVLGEAASPGIPVETKVDLIFAAEEITALACRAFAAHISGIVGDNSLTHMPVLDQLANLDDVSRKLMSANRLLLIRRAVCVIVSCVHAPVLHISAADSRCADLYDYILRSALRLRVILHHLVSAKCGSESL